MYDSTSRNLDGESPNIESIDWEVKIDPIKKQFKVKGAGDSFFYKLIWKPVSNFIKRMR